jgi:hypothetical protein
MARRTREIIIEGSSENRDLGKHFLITEMPATQAESWARRALIALVKGGGAEINEDIAQMGFAGFAYVGVQALTHLNDVDLVPLLDEMMGCLTYYPNTPDTRITRKFIPGRDDCDIEEISTLLFLRKEILDLHVGFSLGSVLSSWKQRMTATTTVDTPSMSTSPSLSG